MTDTQDWGRVSSETSTFYQNRLSARVLELRIQHDCAYIDQREMDRFWQLPEDIRPAEQAASLPTENLLCYGASTALTAEQRSTLYSVGYMDDRIPEVVPGEAGLMFSLLEEVNRHLQRIIDKYVIVPHHLPTRIGSRLQVATVQRTVPTQEAAPAADVTRSYIHDTTIGLSRIALSSKENLALVIFAPRFYYPDNSVNWFCYNFGN